MRLSRESVWTALAYDAPEVRQAAAGAAGAAGGGQCGAVGPALDVYAFGWLLWEAGCREYAGVSREKAGRLGPAAAFAELARDMGVEVLEQPGNAGERTLGQAFGDLMPV